MINDEVNLTSRVDLIGVTTKSLDGITHSSQVNDKRNTGEVLKDNSSGLEGDFNVFGGVNLPVENLFDIRRQDVELVAVSHGTLQEHSDGEGEFTDTLVVELAQCEVLLSNESRDIAENFFEWISCCHLFF